MLLLLLILHILGGSIGLLSGTIAQYYQAKAQDYLAQA